MHLNEREYMEREFALLKMRKALQPLWDDLLDVKDAREACYVRADIDPADAKQHDAEALRLERLRRRVMNKPKQKRSAA